MMCKLTISIILISQIFVFSICGQFLNRRTIQITRLDTECRGKNVPVVHYLKGVKCNTTSAFVQNSTVVIKEDLVNNLKYNVAVQRCQTRENLDSCEEFFKRENGNFCQLINPDNIMSAGSPLAVHYTPKLKCSGKKGVYHAYNFTLSLTPFMVINIDGWYWKIAYDVFSPDGSRLMGCSRMEGYTVLRSKD